MSLRLAVIVGMALLVAIGGCRPQPRQDERGTSAATSTSPASTTPRALAEARGDEGTLAVQVLELKRLSPATVWLKLALVNTASAQGNLDLSQRFASEAPDRGTLADVYLAEPDGARKLFVLRDDLNRPNCSRDLTSRGPGARKEVWAKFPAPPAGVGRLEVRLPLVSPMAVPLS
jgi:hypothetical protein